jgi:hypothetical protein
LRFALAGANLDERVAAGLNVGERRLALRVPHREPFLEAHLLRVEVECLVEVVVGNRYVVHVVDGQPVSLRQQR